MVQICFLIYNLYVAIEDQSKFPITSPGPHELDKGVLEIPLQNLNFETHNTFGEHANKEKGAWDEYLAKVQQRGVIFDIKNSFAYYLQNGPGRFYKAYTIKGGEPMVAGLTLRPNDKNGYMIDSSYNIPDKSVAASAYYTLIIKFFEDFSGVPPINNTTNLTIPIEKLQNNTALARAVFDFGLVRGADFVIPMPGVAPFPFTDMPEKDKDNIRKIITQRSITGLLPYQESRENILVVTEEYYRKGVFVGKAVITYTPIEGEYEQEVRTELQDTSGRPVQIANDISKVNIIRRVNALKILAKRSSLAAGLILS